jgi:SAM-dependent methyltransferase
MELSKELPIFNIINNNLELLNNDTIVIEIDIIKNDGSFTEMDFNNFTNVLRSLGYQEQINNEYLIAKSDQDEMIIKDMPKILHYCMSNSFDNKTIWQKKKLISSDSINGLFDYDLNIKSFNILPFIQPDNWEDLRKQFSITKSIHYINKDNVQFIANLFKSSEDEYYTLKQSNVLKERQNYSFTIKFEKSKYNDKIILQSIITAIQAITLSSMLLTKTQQKNILDEYYNLVKNDIEISYYNKQSNDPPLLTPKPITLERINLIDPKEYGAVSILSEYTITEKADGERVLMYINDTGKVYIIYNNYRVEDTGMTVSQAGYNTIIDGEYIHCHKRKDNAEKNLYAAFDIYYIGGKNITMLPLMDNKDSRYKYLQQFIKLIVNKNTLDFIVKEHKYSNNIFDDTKNILMTTNQYPYDIDGLIFTPAKLAVYGYYTNQPVKLTDNVKWDRVFKWKPEDQNTIDFLIIIDKTITKNGLKYKEAKLHVGYNASQWEDIDIEKGLKLRYDRDYAKQHRTTQQSYVPILFRPTIYYTPGVEYSHIRQNSKGELRAENGDKIESHSIVEFKYINDISIPISERWIPIRVREDKTRIFKKGILSKTANELSVALNIWRSIHNPVSTAMILGNQPVFNKEDSEKNKLLDSDDVYYSRNIPRDYLLSVHMLNFHNQGIKKSLYEKPSRKGSLLELCCGEASDMNRWLDNGFSFILGIDLVKKNIYNPKSGCYSRMLKRRMQFMRNVDPKNKIYFPDMLFVVGDCSVPIKSGLSAAAVEDKTSEKYLKIVMNRQSNVDKHNKYIAGKGADGFDAVSCMFAIHYFFESEHKLDGFLNNVSQNLKKNGVFICTFMNGENVENEINKNGGDLIEGRKLKTDYSHGMPVWAIIRRFNKEQKSPYGKLIDVYIENTQRLIPEYMVSFQLLVKKAKDHGLELAETEMFEQTFNKLKSKIPENEDEYTHLDMDLLHLDKDDIQKQFSFLNQWAVFKKI